MNQLKRLFSNDIALFFIIAIGMFFIIVSTQLEIFSIALYARGDAAANMLLVQKVKNFDLFTGNYSRFGFYHPGPFYLIILAIAEVVLFDWTHIVPAAYNASVLGLMFCMCVCLSLAVIFLKKLFSYSFFKCILLALIFIIVLLSVSPFGDGTFFALWPPFYYLYLMFPFTASLALVFVKRYNFLPWYFLFACALVHGHVSFGFLAILSFGFIFCRFYLDNRKQLRPALFSIKKQLLLSAGIVILFALPMAVETIINYPGQIPLYFQRTNNGGAITLSDVLRYMLQYFQQLPLYYLIVLGLGALLLFASTIINKNKSVLALFYSSMVTFLFTVIYALFFIDNLRHTYVCLYFFAIVIIWLSIAVMGFIEALEKLIPFIVRGSNSKARLGFYILHYSALLFFLIAGYVCYRNYVQTHKFDARPQQMKETYVAALDYFETILSEDPQKKPVYIICLDPGAWIQMVGIIAYRQLYRRDLDVYVHFRPPASSQVFKCIFTSDYYREDVPRDDANIIFCIMDKGIPLPKDASVFYSKDSVIFFHDRNLSLKEEEVLLPRSGPMFRVSDFDQQQLTVGAGQPFTIEAAIANTSGFPFDNLENSSNLISFGLRTLDANGAEVSKLRCMRIYHLSPDETQRYSLKSTTPVVAGQYALQVVMVQEGVGWFSADNQDDYSIEMNVTE